jgi:hypothetical protein
MPIFIGEDYAGRIGARLVVGAVSEGARRVKPE